MKNLKTYNEHVNEEFEPSNLMESAIGSIFSSVIILLLLNFNYAHFGYRHKRKWTKARQKFPFSRLIKYIKMSRIIKRYKKKINEIDENILKRNPEIKQTLLELKSKNEINADILTSPALKGRWFTDSVLDSCTPEERDFVEILSDKFNREMEELFYED